MEKIEEIHTLIESWNQQECIQFLTKNGNTDANDCKQSIWRMREHCKHIASIEFTKQM